MQRTLFALLLAFTLFSFTTSASAAPAAKPAILIVAFGTSVESGKAAYTNVDSQVKAAFPHHTIAWAWSAHSLLTTTAGQPMLSPQQAFANLATQGVKDVTVLTLHIIPGAEYHGLVATAKAFEGLPKGIRTIGISTPLMYNTASLQQLAAILLTQLPPQHAPNEGIVFVGHGTHHPAEVYYPALQYYLQQQDVNAFVGTIEGDMDLQTTLAKLKKQGITKVQLAPLMTVAGEHARNDLFGDEAESWKSTLEKNGITVTPLVQGLGEKPEIAAMWVNSLTSIMAK